MIKARIVPINRIINETVSKIDNRINSIKDVEIKINIGKITGIRFFSDIGPKFNMRLETSRTEYKQNWIQNFPKVELIKLYIEFI